MKPPSDPAIARVTLRGIFDRILEEFHFDRGLGYTVKLLLLHPRRAMEEYLFVDRRRMLRPFTLLLLSVGIATFLSLELLLQEDPAAEAASQLADFPERVRDAFLLALSAVRNYFNLIYMSSLLPMTLATYLVFRRHKLNLAEHLVLNCYLFSVQTWFFILTIPFLAQRADQLSWVSAVPAAFTVWFYKDVFEVGWGEGVLRSVLVFLLGQLFWVVLGVIAFGVLLLIV